MEYYKSVFIDRGTYGRVYKITQYNGKVYALKVYQEKYGINNNILNEIIFLSRITHKNIIEKVNLFIENGSLCLVMPYYPMTLYDFILSTKKEKPRTPHIAKMDQIFNCLMSAIEYIHLNHYIHADIKPTNILLYPDNLSSVKLIDFGCCFDKKIINEYNTFYIQTIWYRAPEVLRKKYYDYKVDIWSLGLVYLEMLTGVTVLPGTNENQLSLINNFNLYKFIIAKFDQPYKIYKQTKLIEKMLKINPFERYKHIVEPVLNIKTLQEKEHIFNDDFYNELPKQINKTILFTVFNWLLYFSQDIIFNAIEITIYSFYIIIQFLIDLPESERNINHKELQLISLASLIIADNLLNLDNVYKKTIVQVCDEKHITIDSLSRMEFHITIKLQQKLCFITPVNFLYYYKQEFPAINNTISYVAISYLTMLSWHIKPSYLVAGLYHQLANPDMQLKIKLYSGYSDFSSLDSLWQAINKLIKEQRILYKPDISLL